MGYAGLRVAVPIASAGSEQTQPERNIGQPSAKIGIMARMPGLHRIQPLPFEPLDESTGASLLEMGNRDYSTGRVDQFRNSLELGKRLLHEGRPPPTEETVERITQVDGAAVPDDRAGDMRPADRATGRFLKHALEREVHTQSPEMLNHFLSPAHPIGPAAFQEGFQSARAGGEEIPQHMHLTPGSYGGELAPDDHPDAVPLAGGEGIGNAGQRVVIGERNGAETCRDGATHDALRRNAPVRGSRMNVQVDRFPGAGGSFGGAQRRYPVSGAVQDGWEYRSRSRSSWSLS